MAQPCVPSRKFLELIVLLLHQRCDHPHEYPIQQQACLYRAQYHCLQGLPNKGLHYNRGQLHRQMDNLAQQYV